jgi:hypothetical protein
LRAILTTQPDIHSFEGDRSLAVANLMLQGIFQAEPVPVDFKQRVANAVEEIRTARKEQFGDNPFLVVVVEGEVASFSPSHEKDAQDFVLCFDGADKEAIRQRLQPAIDAIIACSTSVLDDVIAIKKVADPVVFLRDDGKSVYSYTFSGSANAYVSKQIAEKQVQTIRQRYPAFAANNSLRRVQRLLKVSFETEEDSLRSFLAAWSAFEILVNKVFPEYEDRFFHSVLNDDQSEVQKKYLERIREVMKDKYRLADKFAAIGFQLSPKTADSELKTVLQVKKLRDELSHGESIDEAALPVKAIRDIASKYLRIHFEKEQ